MLVRVILLECVLQYPTEVSAGGPPRECPGGADHTVSFLSAGQRGPCLRGPTDPQSEYCYHGDQQCWTDPEQSDQCVQPVH